MVIPPAPDNRVQESDKLLLFDRFVALDDADNFPQKCTRVVIRRFLQIFPLLSVLPYVPAEKVESVADVRDFGLFRREH